MSRIYDALKKLEAERHGAKADGQGNGHKNGHGTNGNGNGNGHHERGGWRFWRRRRNGVSGGPNGTIGPLSFDLRPDAEEAYQRLGTNLMSGPGFDPAAPPRVLGLVSARAGEGTSTIAALFGSILVRRRGGRVVIVEANYRAPSFDRILGITANGGFAELVRGEQPLAAVAQATAVPNLYAISAGKLNGVPSGLFDAPGLPGALAQLREQFDFVVFDLPPINLYGEGLILGPRLDACILVIEADATRVPEVERARRTLERAGVRFVGSVLNRQRNYIPSVLEEML
jgi:capsular exopolysaccharide synthesis family protein